MRERRAGPSAACARRKSRFRARLHSNARRCRSSSTPFVLGPFPQQLLRGAERARGARRGGRDRPRRRPDADRASSSRGWVARTGGILVTHTDVDHIGGVAELWPTAPAPRSGRPRARSRRCGRARRAAACASPRTIRRTRSSGGDEVTVAGITFEVVDIPGHSAGHVAFRHDGELFSGDLLFAGSVGRVDLEGGDWETLLASVQIARRPVPARDRRLSGTRTGDDARAGAADATRSCASCAPTQTREPDVPGSARDARRPARRRAVVARRRGRWRTSRRSTAGAASRRPGFEDTALFDTHVGRGLRRRAQGDVHVHRPQRPLADAPPGGHCADRTRLRRARPAPRPAAGQGVHDRADVPLRRARARTLSASTTSCRSRRSARPTRRSTPR